MTGNGEHVSLAGARIHVRRTGEGPPLLLINGFGADMTSWKPLIGQLPDREIIAFDQPGMGQSGYTPQALRMPALAQLAEGLLDHLQLQQTDVLGYSLGGVLAQELTLTAPGRVRRLVLAGTTPGIPSRGPSPKLTRMLISRRRYSDEAYALRTLPLLAGGRTARDSELCARAVQRRIAEPPDRKALRRQLWSNLGWSAQRRLPGLQVPTLILHGDDDPLIPLSNPHRLAELIPDSRLEIIAGAGHLFLFDDPACASGLIREHLDTPGA